MNPLPLRALHSTATLTHATAQRRFPQIGFNGGVEGGFAEIQGFFEEACSFMAEQDDVKTVMVMSHWDVEGSGAAADTSTPGAYDKMKTLPGCKELDAKRMLKFTSGHIHCNVKAPLRLHRHRLPRGGHGHVGRAQPVLWGWL